ncbi:unnamed protein product, partial [Mesorhabditis belari]|uniref:Methyltransferase domain-containing protein n=1 Tax=Mesorhabditis belari TaxID=2138241 RepID=A0AAF3FJY9_9BILA
MMYTNIFCFLAGVLLTFVLLPLFDSPIQSIRAIVPLIVQDSANFSDEINLDFKENSEIAQRIHQEQLPQRKTLWSGLNDGQKWTQFYDLISLEAICIGKVRIGGMNDGGKWICSPWRLPDNCVFYSLGINNNIQFEESLHQLINKKWDLIGVDQFTQYEATKARYIQINGKLFVGKIGTKAEKESVGSNVTLTLEEVYKLNKHTKIDLLKMDIEGAEKTVLPELLNFVKPCQILVETHDNKVATRTLLAQISKQGYWLYSWEVNEGDLQACEYSFIHESCVEKFGVWRLARYLS